MNKRRFLDHNQLFHSSSNANVVREPIHPYGFRYNADRTGLIVDDDQMAVVRRIFKAVAAGKTIHSVAKELEADGIPSPGGKKRWLDQSIRRLIFNDAYSGVWYYGRDRVTLTPDDPKRNRRFKRNDPADWIGVPVPSSGIPPETIQAARDDLNRRYRPRKNASRYSELRGLVTCECCNSSYTTWGTTNKGRRYDYYSCVQVRKHGKTACSGPHWRAEDLEGTVANYVSDLLADPKRIRTELDAAIAEENRKLHDPEAAARNAAETIAECDRQRASYQEQQARGYMTLDELGKKLSELDETSTAAQAELDGLRDGQRRVHELKAGRKALLEAYGKGLLQGIEFFPPQVRRRIYELMGLQVTVLKDGRLRVAANVDARIVRLTRSVEDFARKRQEWERRWSDNPPDFDELARRLDQAVPKGNSGLQYQFGQAVDQSSLTTPAITSSEMSKLA